jgi:hypothetical protein
VVELVSPSSGPDEQALFGKPRKIFRLEFRREMVSCEFALREPSESMYEFELFPAKLRDIRPKFLVPQLIEYGGPNSFQML